MWAALCGFMLAFLVVASSAQDIEMNLNFAGMIKGVNLPGAPAAVPDTIGSFPPQILVAPSDPNTVLGVIGSNAFYLQTLSAWITQANLLASFSASPITVFIPSPAALQALGIATLRSYSTPANTYMITQILKNFVVAGSYTTAKLSNGMTLTTLQGQTLTFNAGAINGIPIVQADVAATNGVIQVLGSLIQPPDIITWLTQNGFSGLLSFSQKAGALSALPLNGQNTLFVPTNAALAAIPPATLAILSADIYKLQAFLFHHATPGVVTYGSFRNGTVLPSAQYGQFLHIIVKNCGTYVNGAKIITPNIPVLNGLIHVIDTPIYLNDILTVAADLGHSTFVSVVNAAGLVPFFQNYCPRTVFIPTNAAFAALPAGSLSANASVLATYIYQHVVPADELYTWRFFNTTVLTLNNGQRLGLSTSVFGIYVNSQVPVLQSGIVTSTGIAAIISAVLTPRTIAQYLADTSAFSTQGFLQLYSGLAPFGLVPKFPTTVFAPVDSAFAALTPTEIANLESPAMAATVAIPIFELHVSVNVSRSASWVNGTVLMSLLSTPILIQLPSGQRPMVGAANVLQVDMVATDGVLHIVDGLIARPPGF